MNTRGLGYAKQKPRGIGDVIANITNKTRIDKVVKFAAKAVGKEDCGCTKRQESLNKRFPFKK